MRHLLTLLLGLASVSATACASSPAAEVRAETLRLRITGMT